MTNPIYDLIIEMRTPDRTVEHEHLHIRIALAKHKGTLTDELLNRCADAECIDCGAIVCPHNDPLHFHHDGCPACDAKS